MKLGTFLRLAAGSAAALVLAAALATGGVEAAGKKSVSISLNPFNGSGVGGPPSTSGNVTIYVSENGHKNPYELWVANKCSVRGELVYAAYQPVVWDTTGTTFTGHAGFSGVPEGECSAYVWAFPASESPIGGATTSY